MSTHPGPPGVRIRSARPEDVASLVSLLVAGSLQAGQEDPADLGPYVGALTELAASAPNDVLVAESNGEVVGMCQLLVLRHLQAHGGRCAEIESMHVRPDRRGDGIGARLLEAAVARARALGCYRVQLTSNRVRTDAHRFYERAGFEPTHVGFKLRLDSPPADGDVHPGGSGPP